MSLTEQTPRVQVTISTATDAISFPYKFLESNDLVVVSSGRGVLFEATDYTVTGAGVTAGGTVTMIGATVAEIITIVRATDISQELDLTYNGAFLSQSIEDALDKLTQALQDSKETLARCLKMPQGEIDGYISTLDDASTRALKVLAFDENGAISIETIAQITLTLEAALEALSKTADNIIVADGADWTSITKAAFLALYSLEVGTDIQAYSALLAGIDQALDVTASPAFVTLTADHIQLDTAPSSTAYSEGKVYWNPTEKTLNIDLGVDGVTVQVGQEHHTPLILNSTGSTILNGQVCRINSSATLSLAQADTEANSNGTIGLATHDIENGTSGFITTYGLTRNVDTSAYAVGTTLWLDASTAGGFTDVKPTFAIKIGTVWTQDALTGSILVSVEDMRVVSTIPFFKDFTFNTATAGTYYVGGFWNFAATDANLTQAATTQTIGFANFTYGAHASLVAGGAGTASGGTGAVSIVVSGTSIGSDGIRTPADSEVIVSDITEMTTNAYYETVKKWLGQVTYTLTVGATGHTAYAADFNYGLSKYDDLGDRAFNITDFEIVGLGGAAESGANFTLYKHNDQGWTYAATGFDPTSTLICDMATDQSTDVQWTNNAKFAYKRTGLSTPVDGANSLEGFIVKITTQTNNSITYANVHIGATI